MGRSRDYHGKLWLPCTYVVSFMPLQPNMVLKQLPTKCPKWFHEISYRIDHGNRFVHRRIGIHPDTLNVVSCRMRVLLSTPTIFFSVFRCLFPLKTLVLGRIPKADHTNTVLAHARTTPSLSSLQCQTINCATIKLSRSVDRPHNDRHHVHISHCLL